MVRDSAKHGPRLDEEMRREAEGGRRSGGTAATEEMAVPRRSAGHPPGREPGTPAGTTPREIAWRSELAQILSPMGFPATRGRILAYLNEVQAPHNVMLTLIGLPKDRQYANVGEVVRALGVHTEAAGPQSTGEEAAGEEPAGEGSAGAEPGGESPGAEPGGEPGHRGEE